MTSVPRRGSSVDFVTSNKSDIHPIIEIIKKLYNILEFIRYISQITRGSMLFNNKSKYFQSMQQINIQLKMKILQTLGNINCICSKLNYSLSLA